MAGKIPGGALMVALLLAGAAFSEVSLIFDTDFGGDADDLGALAMLHRFVDKGECDVLGVMCFSTETNAVPAIKAVNRFYGHPNIPIGQRKGDSYVSEWSYGKVIAERFGHRKNLAQAEEATSLYRKLLAKSADHSVVIVTVGPLANIKNLIQSPADAYSKLDGKALVEKKVKGFVIMGGQFPQGKKEWNFSGDMPGVTQFVLSSLSVPVTFTGFEVGAAIRTGAVFNKLDPDTPLHVGFLFFSQQAPWMKEHFSGAILDNASFDQTAVLYAVRNGTGTYWDKVGNGYCLPDEKGGNIWMQGEKYNHTYLRLTADPEKMATLVESIMLHSD